MSLLKRMISAVSRWADGADWKSWVTHGVLAIPLTFLVGAHATMVFYFLRECEQYLHEVMANKPPKYKDHVIDFVVPTVVAGVIAWVYR